MMLRRSKAKNPQFATVARAFLPFPMLFSIAPVSRTAPSIPPSDAERELVSWFMLGFDALDR